MRKLAVVLIMAFLTLDYFQKQSEPAITINPAPASQIAPPTNQVSPPVRAVSFTCDGRQHCSQMRSRAEAEFFVSNCPNTKMDGDNDGEPCENDSRF